MKPEVMQNRERRKARPFIRLATLFFAGSLGLVACRETDSPAEDPTPSAQEQSAARAAEAPESIQRKWTLLNRIRQDETLFIGRTLLNEQNQLGVVLASSVTPEKAPAIMQEVMTEMAHHFPKEEIEIMAYQSATPPRKLGVAHLAPTGEISYQLAP